MWFQTTISKWDIKNFIDENKWNKWDIIKKIQDMKEDSINRLVTWFSQEKVKFIDPMLIKWIEKEYFDIIKKYDWEIDNNFDYSKQQKEIEKMFKNHDFNNNYIWNFENIKGDSLLETPKDKLKKRRSELTSLKIKWKREYDETKQINKALNLLNNNEIQNTKSRKISFDKNEFKKLDDKFNVQCFFEEDKWWNKNHFSINELLNDLETFGVESGYPILDIDSLWSYGKEFHTVQKFIKVTLLKSILAKYRNYQEIVMYNIRDYEKHKWASLYESKPWILAEQIVERSFRNSANLDNKHSVTVKKASVWEDQNNTVDLIIQIQDEESKIKVEKELQLTINKDSSVLKHKKQQINKQKRLRHTDIDLLPLELNWLYQKTTVWRNSDRPIWWLDSLLSIEDKEFLKITYDRIIEELNEKILQKTKVIKLDRNDKAISA